MPRLTKRLSVYVFGLRGGTFGSHGSVNISTTQRLSDQATQISHSPQSTFFFLPVLSLSSHLHQTSFFASHIMAQVPSPYTLLVAVRSQLSLSLDSDSESSTSPETDSSSDNKPTTHDQPPDNKESSDAPTETQPSLENHAPKQNSSFSSGTAPPAPSTAATATASPRPKHPPSLPAPSAAQAPCQQKT